MNKETLVRLAMPASIVLLALAIISRHLTSNALDAYDKIYVEHLNSCA